MDAYITEVKAANNELNLKKEAMEEKGEEMTKDTNAACPSQIILQQQLQIHDDDTVSTFRENRTIALQEAI